MEVLEPRFFGKVLCFLAGYGKTAFLTIPRCCRLPFQMI
jgi:hypothetical protein